MGSRNTSAGLTQNIRLGIDKKRSTDVTDIKILGRGIYETLNIGLNSEYVRKDGAIDQITTRSHTQLTDIGTNSHTQIDTAIGTITPLTATTVGSLIAGVDAKATPADADIVGFSDTQATNILKKLTWTNIKAFLKTYFDTLYNLYSLPTASDSVLGGVKVGTRLSIAEGVLSADVQGGAPTDAHYLTDQAEAGLSAEVVVTANGKSLVTAADYAAMRTLLNVADGANNYTHPSGDGNLHVPANSTTNNGKVLTASAVAGTYTWETPSATVADESITNAKLAHIATSTIKGRVTAATGDVEDLTAANVRTIINVEDGADVTDATNVDAAGATMNADTNVKANGWVIDEDTLATNSDEKVPTQQSVKAYVDAHGGSVEAASQAEMEAATSDTKVVTPLKVKYSPNALKAWIVFNGEGTVAILDSNNMTALTDNGTGNYTITFTARPNTNFGWSFGLMRHDTSTATALCAYIYHDAITASTLRIITKFGDSGAYNDLPHICVVIFDN